MWKERRKALRERERERERGTVVDKTGNHVDDCIRVIFGRDSFLTKIRGPGHPESAVHLLDTRGGSRAVCVASFSRTYSADIVPIEQRFG